MRYAVVTQHPNRQDRSLQVHSWHPTEEAADGATLRMVMEFSETVDGVNRIPSSLCGLAIVVEDQLCEVVPGQEWTWAPRRTALCFRCGKARTVASVRVDVHVSPGRVQTLEALECDVCSHLWIQEGAP